MFSGFPGWIRAAHGDPRQHLEAAEAANLDDVGRALSGVGMSSSECELLTRAVPNKQSNTQKETG